MGVNICQIQSLQVPNKTLVSDPEQILTENFALNIAVIDFVIMNT